ncbi:MAG: hypothetical protein ACLQIQ_11580 [Beijerinckiaceae bacterium]
MAQLDRLAARALVEAGYMPLDRYIELFSEGVLGESKHVVLSLIETHDPQPVAKAKHGNSRSLYSCLKGFRLWTRLGDRRDAAISVPKWAGPF